MAARSKKAQAAAEQLREQVRPAEAPSAPVVDRERVRAALDAALANPIYAMGLEELEKLADGHPLGESRSGWVNPYPAGDPRSLLKEYQFKAQQDGSRFKAAVWSRQIGKDFTFSGETVADCLTRTTAWMVAAPSERQSLDSLEQDKLWAEAYDLHIADYRETREGNHSETLLKSAEVTFSNGSKITAVPGKPDTVRGKSVNVRITEFDFLENPTATWRAILPSITNPLRGGEKKVRVYSTPNGVGSQMHKIVTKGDTDDGFKWSTHVCTLLHAVLCGLPVDWKQLRAAMDDPEGFLQECLCQFLDTSNVLLPYELIALAEDFEATERWDFLQAGTSHPVFLGIDFGRTNDPTVCWTLQTVGDIDWTREVLVLEKMDSPDQQQILRDRIKGATRVCFDYTGPGIGLGDYLVKEHGEWKPTEHKFGKIELCTFTAGFKRELFPRLRSRFTAPTRLRIPVSIAIREDLRQMQQVISSGEYNYWSPRTKKGHSDRCTALALANRARSITGPGTGAFTLQDLRGVHLGRSTFAGPRFTRPTLRF
jgi:phage FluMu gp28-like protein